MKRITTYITIILLGLITGLTDPYMTYNNFAPDQYIGVEIKMKIDPGWGMVGYDENNELLSLMFRYPSEATIRIGLMKEELDDLLTLFGGGSYSGDNPPIAVTLITQSDTLNYGFTRFQELGLNYKGNGNILITQKQWKP
jgi:hypothetical protein